MQPKKPAPKKQLFDIESEKQVILGLLKHGEPGYYDVNSLIQSTDFSQPYHYVIYEAVGSLVKNKILMFTPDLILKEIRAAKVSEDLIKKYNIDEYLYDLNTKNVTLTETIEQAKHIGRLGCYRAYQAELEGAISDLENADLSNPVMETIGLIESRIFNFNNKLVNANVDILEMKDEVDNVLQNIVANKGSFLGVPLGFPILDSVLGGGLRSPGVAIFGARPKFGKTTFNTQVALNVARLNIPVLFLDTEMTIDGLLPKMLANLSDTEIDKIEQARFTDSPVMQKKVDTAANTIKHLPISYKSVAGLSHHQIIAIARKWVHKTVGFDVNGKSNPCLIILDYIKTMDLGQLKQHQEYQYLGQYVTDLHNFAVEHNLPVLAMVQLNRDGIDLENGAAISGSDRILWLCTSFCILKNKSPEDEIADPISNGNVKMIVTDARYGPGLRAKEYINCHFDRSKATVLEGPKNTSVQASSIQMSKSTTGDENIEI